MNGRFLTTGPPTEVLHTWISDNPMWINVLSVPLALIPASVELLLFIEYLWFIELSCQLSLLLTQVFADLVQFSCS